MSRALPARSLAHGFAPPYYPARLLEQILVIGYFSLPVVGLTAVFIGSALAQQIFIGGSRFNAAATVPAVVVIGIVRELGPVLGGLMVAGRVSSAMAAELGTMRVTEQIDALATLRTDPYRYLIAPRLVAAVLVMPFLVLVANSVGVLGGFLLATNKLRFNAGNYLATTMQYLKLEDVASSMVKAGSVRLHHRADGLLPRLQLERRRGGGRQGDDQRRRLGLHPDPAVEPDHHRDRVRLMSDIPKIALKGVRKRFGDKHVLNGVDLNICAGESMVIIGGSGTGKSVTIKCILGLIRPDAGHIEVDGQDVTHLKGRALAAHQARFGMLFQGGALFDSLSVWRNVAFALDQRQGGTRLKAAAIDNLARVGLGSDVADLKPSELSGGMQKRVALARAIAPRPEIIFFDEPTTGLDPIMADVINDLIVELVKDLKITALTITHDMASVRKIADRVAMLYNGRIVWHGPRQGIDATANPYVYQFVNGRAEGPIKMAVRGR